MAKPKVLISDALSPAAVQIFKDRGVEVDFQPNLGKDKDKLAEIIGNYDGLAIRSNTSVCLSIVDPAVTTLAVEAQSAFAKSLSAAVEKEGAGYDIAHYRDAPPGLRIWCGATVDTADIEALGPWLDWAYAETRAALATAA